MNESKFNIVESIKNIKQYCESNCNHGECKTCIFYSPMRYACPFLDQLTPYNWGNLLRLMEEQK